MPTIAEVFSLALQHHQAGDLLVAERLYQNILQADPAHADSHHLLGVLACQQGRHDHAIAAIRRAISLKPGTAAYYSNLGVAQEAVGKPEEAEASYRHAILLQADYAEAHGNLGNALLRKGKLEEAQTHYRQALQVRPDYPEAHNGLGNVLLTLGKLHEAASHYQSALNYRLDFADAHNGLANALLGLGKLEEAAQHYRQAMRLRPDFHEAFNGLGNTLLGQNKFQDAVAEYQQALRIRPDYPEAHNGLGNALERLDKLDQSVHFCREALRLKPDFPEAYYNLGNTLVRQNLLDEAIDCYRRAIQLKPDYAEARSNLGTLLLREGELQPAFAEFQRAVQTRPDLATAQSNLLFSLNYLPDAGPDQVFAEHCRWGRSQELAAGPKAYANDPDPERRLRIGYVSPDLCFHPLTRYFEPVLANHDPETVEVFCYAEVARPDAVTARLQHMTHGWRWTYRQSDAQVAQQIRDDRIDILVDLAGHTRDNRLPVIARKPAPVQATWLGYLNTTGLQAIDYRLTDEILDPPGEAVRDTEELLRLPMGMCCFAPPADAPAGAPLPALQSGHVTFGSLSSLFKLNDLVFDLWSRVLKAVPSSRLLMFHHTLTAAVQKRLRRQFSERGIANDRLDLRRGTFEPGYLSVYNEIDVSLDTFPYAGGVTTCESLWMGVPVISLRGQRPAGRNSAALLTRAGLIDWIAQTPDQYLSLAVDWTANLDRLAELRSNLRDRLVPTLCDGQRFTRGLEEAYRTMWRRWCARSHHHQREDAEAHNFQANRLQHEGKFKEAADHFRKAVQIRPEYLEAHNNLGNVLLALGSVDEAIGSYRAALRLDPNFGEANYNLGTTLAQHNQPDEAIRCLRKALAINPNLAEGWNNLGNALEQLDQLDEAIDCFRQALRLQPGYADALVNLGNVLHRQSKIEKAIPCYQEALRLNPGSAKTHFNLGTAFLNRGSPDLALTSFEKALQLQPGMSPAQTNLLFGLNYHPGLQPEEVFERHRSWGRQHEPATPAEPHDNDVNPERRLRIGYVSPDLRQHALVRYLEPVFVHHDSQNVQIFCYAEVPRPDAVTQRLQGLVHGWCWTPRLSDAQLAERIRSDHIDILVDLAGHSANSRLTVFALKPAPVQVTWLGYMNTTGLRTIDYRLTDEYLDPSGKPMRDTEELFRLPEGMCCFAPPPDAPNVTPLPAVQTGRITFGSLHNVFKINSKVIELWSRTLCAVPGSRLLMYHHTLSDDAQERLRRQFEQHGIAAERLDLRQGSAVPGYLGVYGEIDVSLDAFPCTGGVTTCESLWMGVPVLTLNGVRPAGRNSAALLHRVGLTDWAVQTPDDFVAFAARMPDRLDYLAQLRSNLRGQVTGLLCDAERFTRQLEDAYRSMWHRWCSRRGV